MRHTSEHQTIGKIFSIYQVDEAAAERIQASVNEPHVHQYEELILATDGTVDHFIDFKTSRLDAPFVAFVAKGKMHKIVPGLKNGKCRMWVVRFQSEFIADTSFQLYAHYHHHANIPLQPNKCYDRMVQLCQIMFDEMQRLAPDLSIVRHLLMALFSMVEAERRQVLAEHEPSQSVQNETFKSFLKILEDNYSRPVGVEFYAEKLFMTSRNLNLICKNVLNQSVSEIIETRKLIEAKHLLIDTDKTVAEIGYELGYTEKSYFTNVFKRKAGQTPTEFRHEMRQQLQ